MYVFHTSGASVSFCILVPFLANLVVYLQFLDLSSSCMSSTSNVRLNSYNNEEVSVRCVERFLMNLARVGPRSIAPVWDIFLLVRKELETCKGQYF